MKIVRIIPIVLLVMMICCKNTETKQSIIRIDADSLIEHIDRYIDSSVEIEGVIVHICNVDGKKMKLKTKNGAIIKIVPLETSVRFDSSFYKKRISVQGIVKELRIERNSIDEIAQEKTLLCHIDNTPCKDTAWVNRQIKSGIADSLSNRDILRLRNKMKETKKDYVSVVTIIAERYKIIQNK